MDAQERGFERVMKLKTEGWGTKLNGWQMGPPNHGDYEDDFVRRAYGTFIGGMWPTNKNSTYWLAYVDSDGALLDGSNTYELRFEGDNLPPATKFWSVTLYEAGTFDLYPHEVEAYMIGSNNPKTKKAKDGSITTVFSHEKPKKLGKKNWIAAPKGPFFVAIRFYAPTPEVLSEKLELPAVVKK